MDSSYTFSKQRRNTNKDRFKRVLFFVLISLTIIQQMPVIKDMFYNQIRVVLYLGFGLFSVISFFSINKFSKIRFIRYFILTIAYSFLLFFIIKVFEGSGADIFELLIPFGVLICSLNTNFNKRQLSTFLIYYVLLSVVLGVSSIFYYGEGFTITRTYFLARKNQIGPLLGTSTIITEIWILNKKPFDIKHNNAIFKIGIFILLISSILIIRNRSGLVGIFITCILALLKEYKLKKSIKNILIIQATLLILIVLFFNGVFDSVIDAILKSLFYNYNITDLNSVSAGRTDVYKLSLEFVKQYPVLGELGSGQLVYSTPHNYILNKWVNFGIIGSLPLVLFYLYLWLFTFKGIFKSNIIINFSLPLWVLLFSLIVSMFEYTYPYGPGVSQLMLWFLLGQYFRQCLKDKKSTKRDGTEFEKQL